MGNDKLHAKKKLSLFPNTMRLYTVESFLFVGANAGLLSNIWLVRGDVINFVGNWFVALQCKIQVERSWDVDSWVLGYTTKSTNIKHPRTIMLPQ